MARLTLASVVAPKHVRVSPDPRVMLVDVQDRIAAGKALDQIKADNPAKKYDIGGFVNADAFATMVFESLGATAGGHVHH